MKVILDTNIILDSFQARVPFNEQSDIILSDCALRKYDAYITSKSFTDIHYVLHKDLNNEKETRRFLKAILLFSKVLDTKGEESIKAIDSPVKDYEDAMIEETAYEICIDIIITRNKKDFKNSRVPAITPEEFIKQFYVDGIFTFCSI